MDEHGAGGKTTPRVTGADVRLAYGEPNQRQPFGSGFGIDRVQIVQFRLSQIERPYRRQSQPFVDQVFNRAATVNSATAQFTQHTFVVRGDLLLVHHG